MIDPMKVVIATLTIGIDTWGVYATTNQRLAEKAEPSYFWLGEFGTIEQAEEAVRQHWPEFHFIGFTDFIGFWNLLANHGIPRPDTLPHEKSKV